MTRAWTCACRRRAGAVPRRQPLRVVLDSRLRTPPAAQMFGVGGEVMILTGLDALDEARAAALSARGARVESLPAGDGGVELTAVLDRLGELEVNEALVEAGRDPGRRSCCASSWRMSCSCTSRPRFLGPAARATGRAA